MDVVAFQLLDELVEIGCYEFVVMLGAVIYGPCRTLGQAIGIAQKMPHQLFELNAIAVDIIDDRHCLAF